MATIIVYSIICIIFLLCHYEVDFSIVEDYFTITYIQRKRTLEGYNKITYTKKLIKIR